MSKDNMVIGDNYRFTVITDRMIRMEYQDDGQFENRTTQTVINRNFDNPDYTVLLNQSGFAVQIDTKYFHLYYRGGEFNGANLFIDGKYNYKTHYNRWHFGDPDEKNLLGTARTLDKIDGRRSLEQGLMSRNGFAQLDDSDSMIQEGTHIENRPKKEIDVYEFEYGHDYQAALTDFYQLSGFPPIVPRFALGNWWSRFFPYTQESYLKLMHRFDQEKIPINVSVFDMNWHVTDIPARYMSGWTGYTWNRKLFPDVPKMLAQLHHEGRHVTLNVHPAAGIRPTEEQYPTVAKAMGVDAQSAQPILFDLNDSRFISAYFRLVHHPLEDQGVDFWWLDWQQGGSRAAWQIDPLWTLNALHFTDAEKRHGDQALILSRYAGPGSQRYPIGFSGDSVASWASLKFQPYFTATATNIGYTWWSHDIGGHMHGTYDPELSLRWLQLGVFSPIMRLHSSDNIFMGKEPWNYDVQTQQAMTKFMQLRLRLIPYIETANIKTHDKGVALVRPLYYDYPEADEAYQYQNEYMFGDQMVVIPITQPNDTETSLGEVTGFVPEGKWTDLFTGQSYIGPATVKFHRASTEYPVLVKAGGILPLNPDFMDKIDQLPQRLSVRLFPGKDNKYTLTEVQSGHRATTTFTWNEQKKIMNVVVNDPASITPIDRQFTVSAVNTDQKQTFSLVDGHAVLSVEPATTQEEQAQTRHRLRALIQHAKIGFDLKASIWNAVITKEPQRAALTVQSLIGGPVADAILEILLNE